mmetsp:Transcript_27329/g.37539  ORF Transcript_27329/g.37539 Transcript_27329/m.37539 type:complete len:223 (-) Transcript_27329:475-1143(-)
MHPACVLRPFPPAVFLRLACQPPPPHPTPSRPVPPVVCHQRHLREALHSLLPAEAHQPCLLRAPPLPVPPPSPLEHRPPSDPSLTPLAIPLRPPPSNPPTSPRHCCPPLRPLPQPPRPLETHLPPAPPDPRGLPRWSPYKNPPRGSPPPLPPSSLPRVSSHLSSPSTPSARTTSIPAAPPYYQPQHLHPYNPIETISSRVSGTAVTRSRPLTFALTHISIRY